MTSSNLGIRNFVDFKEYALWYLHDVGLNIPELLNQEYKVVLAPTDGDLVEFGDFAGRPRFRGPEDLPKGEWNGRTYLEILANLGNIQGDTEFGSNELQVGLWDSAPSDYDRKILLSVIAEEFRHGWQMGYFETEVLRCDEGRSAAQSLLERRASQEGNERLLGAFNQQITDWLGMYCFLEFMDRDGGSQLTLLQHSAMNDLARSMVFMLREERKHLSSGFQGLERILTAGKVPVDVIQRYVNLYAPLGYDLHGGERSTNALIYYRLGLKGFYPDRRNYLDLPPDSVIDAQLLSDLRMREKNPLTYSYQFVNLGLEGPTREINKELLNSITVTFYKRTLEDHFRQFNEIIRRTYPAGTPELVVPSLRFHRAEPSIYARERFDIHGNPISSEAEFRAYVTANLPTPADRALMKAFSAEKDRMSLPSVDIYQRMTVTKPTDEVLHQTVFGTVRRSSFTSSLSQQAHSTSAMSPSTPEVADERPLWQFMDEEAS